MRVEGYPNLLPLKRSTHFITSSCSMIRSRRERPRHSGAENPNLCVGKVDQHGLLATVTTSPAIWQLRNRLTAFCVKASCAHHSCSSSVAAFGQPALEGAATCKNPPVGEGAVHAEHLAGEQGPHLHHLRPCQGPGSRAGAWQGWPQPCTVRSQPHRPKHARPRVNGAKTQREEVSLTLGSLSTALRMPVKVSQS